MFVKVFLLAALCQLVLCDDDIEGRIVAGVSADILEVPYQVYVRSIISATKTSSCGGTILSANAILTAAHCMFDDYDRVVQAVSIRAGSSDARNGGQVIDVAEIYIHENYNKLTSDYDISILKLANNLEFGDRVKMIDIASFARKNGDIAVVSGWGLTDPDNKQSTTRFLRKAYVNYIDSESCRKKSHYQFKHIPITRNMICAGFLQGAGPDSCGGDSGGPLIQGSEVIGVVSFGVSCGASGYPGVYTDVYRLKDWISTILLKIKEVPLPVISDNSFPTFYTGPYTVTFNY